MAANSEAKEAQGSLENERKRFDINVTSIDNSPDTLESNAKKPSRDLIAAIWAIVCGVALPCIPILVISAVLLWFIYHYRVIPQAGLAEFHLAATAIGSTNLSTHIQDIRHNGGDPAYYVDYRPTTITTIAGWTGRIIPYLSSSIMALIAFFAARHIVLKSQRGKHDDLPTPKQLSILITLLGGNGLGPLKETAMYRWKNKEKLVAPLPAVLAALTLITVIGLLIPVVDTWFGLSVHSATITQLYQIHQNSYHSFGRQLDTSEDNPSNCSLGPMHPADDYNNAQTFAWPCNIFMPTVHAANMFVVDPQASANVQLGLATNDSIVDYTGSANASGSEAPSTNVPIYYIGDHRSSASVDFRGQTMGMSTQCEIITHKCVTGNNGSAFSCPGGFEGDFSECGAGTWPGNGSVNGDSGGCTTGIGFAADAQLSGAGGIVSLSSGSPVYALLPRNPMYFGTWATGFPSAADTNSPLTSDGTDIFLNSSTTASWLLNCSATVYEIDYTWVNGSLHTFNATPASAEWGAFFSAPFAWGVAPSQFNLELAAFDTSYSASSAADLANRWAKKFSYYALSTSVGTFAPQVNRLEQARNSTVTVTRVPIVPLYLLLGLKWLYVVVVICMAIGVYCFTHPAETEVVKAQLSVKGLVTAHFDHPDLLQKGAVQQVQSRLDLLKRGGDGDGSSQAVGSAVKAEAGIAAAAAAGTAAAAAAASSEPDQELTHKPKVGLVPTADGTWKFAILVNEAWLCVKPIVQDVVLQDAQAGKLGSLGQDYAAWKK
ncbi:hypothetical protein diail_3313 [Diaporthe ilicicola]|nr:hypothetical protein diail_3313 [Diaporthe ilicicola]